MPKLLAAIHHTEMLLDTEYEWDVFLYEEENGTRFNVKFRGASSRSQEHLISRSKRYSTLAEAYNQAMLLFDQWAFPINLRGEFRQEIEDRTGVQFEQIHDSVGANNGGKALSEAKKLLIIREDWILEEAEKEAQFGHIPSGDKLLLFDFFRSQCRSCGAIITMEPQDTPPTRLLKCPMCSEMLYIPDRWWNVMTKSGFFRDEKSEEALQSHRDALEINREIGNPLGQAQALGRIAIVYMKQGKPEEALKSNEDALQILEKVDDRLGHIGRAAILGNIGSLYQNMGRPEEALQYHRDSIEIEKKIGNLLGIAQTLNNIGTVYRNQGKPEEAHQSYNEAFQMFKKIDEPLGHLGLGEVLTNIGLLYQTVGMLEKALQVYDDALDIFEGIGNLPGQARILNNIGIVYQNQNKLEEALKSYDAGRKLLESIGDTFGLDIFERMGNPRGQAHQIGNIGLLHLGKSELSEALQSFNAALDIFERIDNPLGQANQLANIGYVCDQQGERNMALQRFSQARDIFLKTGTNTKSLR